MENIKLKDLCYEVSFQEADFSGQSETIPVIKNVVLLGAESINKRRYTRECLRNAVHLYEGVQAFVNHPTEEERRTGLRDIRNLAGKFTNPRFIESELKIKADFVGLPNDEAAKKFINIAQAMPTLAGLSQNALAQARFDKESGIDIIESIKSVDSVDLVAKPASTKNMFESKTPNNGDSTMEYSDITILGLKEKRADLVTDLITEGQELRNDEVKKITESETALKTKLDEYEVKEKLQHKQEVIGTVLIESELSDDVITDIFRENLNNISAKTDDEIKVKAKAMCDDRRHLLEGSGGVKNVTEKGSTTKGKGKTISAQEAVRKLTGRNIPLAGRN